MNKKEQDFVDNLVADWIDPTDLIGDNTNIDWTTIIVANGVGIYRIDLRKDFWISHFNMKLEAGKPYLLTASLWTHSGDLKVVSIEPCTEANRSKWDWNYGRR